MNLKYFQGWGDDGERVKFGPLIFGILKQSSRDNTGFVFKVNENLCMINLKILKAPHSILVELQNLSKTPKKNERVCHRDSKYIFHEILD